MIAETILALSLAVWCAQAGAAARAAAAIRRVSELPPPARSSWPLLSLIIPSRNEGAAAVELLRSRLGEGYPNLEVRFVDDRSDDDTAEAVAALAAADPRVSLERIDELPDGWLGKVHAMDRGLHGARGEWVLFSDADVRLAPGTLQAVVAWAEDEGADHVAVLPSIRGGGPLIAPCLATFFRLVSTAPRLWAVADERSSAAVGVGAFNLVRRAALDRSPGLAWLKMEIADDVGLGVMLKHHARARSRVLVGGSAVSLEFYPSFAALCRALEKNGATAPLPLIAAAVALLVVAELGWVLVFSWSVPVGFVVWASLAAVGAAVARWLGSPVVPAILPGVGGALLGLAMLRSAILATVRGGVVWRGTFYSTAAVRAGRRLR